jgi:HlyD family secretion protein
LAVLDRSVVDAARASAAAEVGRARQRLRELRNGPRTEEIAASAAQLAAAEADQEQTAREYQRLADVAARGLIAPSQLDAQRRLRDGAAAGVAAARANLQLLQKGTRAEQLAQAQEALTAAEGQLAQEDAQRARLTLLAPVDGTVEALPYRQGERPPAGAAVVIMLAAGAPYARVYVPEPRRAAITAGQQVQVRVDGRTGALPGVVRFIAGEASFTPYFALTQRDRSRLTYLAEIDLGGDAARDLPVGVPVEVVPGAAP